MRLLGVVVGALVWPLLAWATTATAADADRPRQMLLLYAESRLLPGLIEAERGLPLHGRVQPGSICRPRQARHTSAA